MNELNGEGPSFAMPVVAEAEVKSHVVRIVLSCGEAFGLNTLATALCSYNPISSDNPMLLHTSDTILVPGYYAQIIQSKLRYHWLSKQNSWTNSVETRGSY